VSSFGPITDWSCVVALADIVMMAFRKSPADVCVEVEWSGPRKAISRGTRSCCCSHYDLLVQNNTLSGQTHINNTLTALALFKTDNLKQQVHNDGAVDMLKHVCHNVVKRLEEV